jgi:hypothetical protein
MLKLKSLINVLLVLTISFCLSPINSSIAGDCAEKKIGGEVQTVSGDHNYIDSWFPKIQFDPSNKQQLDRNNIITIKIIGGCSPYTWSVSGNGFSLQESQTTGLSNTLIIDGTACGTGTITVTGCSGIPVKGYVRCTTGRWSDPTVVCGHDSLNPGCPKLVRGNLKYFIRCGCWPIDGCETCLAYHDIVPYCDHDYCQSGCAPCACTQPPCGRGISYISIQEWICY